jgi:hypothetical protein
MSTHPSLADTGHDVDEPIPVVVDICRLLRSMTPPADRAALIPWLSGKADLWPYHVVRFGSQVDVKGVLAGSAQAEECIGYLVKYLVKDLGDDLTPAGQDQLGNHAPGRELPEAKPPVLADTKASAAPPGGSHLPAGGGAPVGAVLAAVRELAAVWHPAQEGSAESAPGLLPREGAQADPPRLRRPSRPGE